MRRLKRRIAGMMVGILCVINVLQPLCTYADELSQTSETVMETVAESESVQSSATEAEPETASDNSVESEPEPVQNETETVETIAESETEPESVSEPEPIHYTVSGIYSGQGHLTIIDNLGNIYEIPEPEEEKSFECDEQSQVILKVSTDDGYEIESVEISQQENIESITDKEILNASEIYEKTITVTADTKIKVTFEELETESEKQSEVEPETESGLEVESEDETKSEVDENEKGRYEGIAKDESKKEITEGYFAEDEDEMDAILHPEFSLFSYNGQTLYVSAGTYTALYDNGFTNRYNVSGDNGTMHYAYCLQPDAPDPAGSATVYEVDNFTIKLVLCLAMYGPAEQYGFYAGVWPGVDQYGSDSYGNYAKLPAAFGYVHATLGYLYGAGPGVGLSSANAAQLDSWVQSCIDIYNSNPEVKKIVDNAQLFYMYGGYFQDVAWVEYTPPQNGWIELQKASANPEISVGGCYSLAGAVYGVYDASGAEITQLVTDANGYAKSGELPVGDYFVKEITAPSGFALDMTAHSVTVLSGETSHLDVVDYPQSDPILIILSKVSENGNIGIADAEFTVKYYSNYDASGTPERTWVLKTNANGKTAFVESLKVSGDEFYRDSTGSETLPLGSITIQETKAPEGYLINNEVFVRQITSSGVIEQVNTYNAPTISETPQVIQIELEKLDSETNKGTAQGTGTLAGAKYEVRDADNKVVDTLITDDTGHAISKELPLGVYTVKETKSSKGYLVDTKSYTVDGSKPKDTTTRVFKYKVQSKEQPQKIQIELSKVDSETLDGAAQGMGTLLGAEYEVLDTNDKVVDVMITDDAGHAASKELPLGDYTVKERKPSSGYLLDPEIYLVEASEPKDTITQVFKYKVKSKEVPQKIQIELEKLDSETNGAAAQGAASLEGATYDVVDSKGKIVDTLITDKKGYAISKELPVDIYKVSETGASNGYLVDKHIYTVDASKPKDSVTQTFTYKVTSGEDIIRGDVEIIKFRENLDAENDTLQGIEGVEFTFTSKTTGKIVTKIVTDKKGFATTASADQPRGSLVFDTYIVTETKCPEGLKPVEPFEVTISEDGVTLKGIYKEDKLIVSPVSVVKKDKTTGSVIPVSNTEFRLLDADKNPVTMTTYYPNNVVYETFKTDDKGQFTFPDKLQYGTYYLEEVNAPEGYLKGELLQFKVTDGANWENPLVIEYDDVPAMGKIRVEKTDAESGKPLDGAEFDIVAAEDIITPDGTVRLQKGDIADHLVTKDGQAESKELYLGSYELRETKQPQGYVLNTDVYSVTLAYKDQLTPVVIQTVNIENQPTKVRIIKVDAESGEALPGVEFKIWNKAMTDDEVDGGMTAEMLCKTDKDGIIELSYLAPGTYCVQETQSIYGYALDDTIHEFVVSEDGRIDGKEIGEITITNTPIEIGTKATDKVDGDQLITNTGKETVVDTVSYKGLIPGKEYTVSGILMVKSTGKPLMDNDKEVTAQKDFIPEAADGEVELTFTFNAKALAGEKLVAFESIEYDKIEIAAHADIEDKDQTVEVVPVEIGTKAADKEDGDQVISNMPKVTIVDTVKYSNLHDGWSYTVKGVLMDKSTGKELLLDGKKITSETKFTAKGTEGTVDVEFIFDASALAGQELVVFEELYYESEMVAEHKDIKDKGQTIEIVEVKIGTKATDKVDGDQVISADEEMTIVDTVTYTNLIPGREYMVSGILMDKATGKALLVDGKEIISNLTFKAPAPDGEVQLEFTFDASALAGKTIVVFEKLLYEGKEIAVHEDITDVDQSVEVVPPEIKTTAVNKADGSKDIIAKGKITIVDTVSYTNLIPGREYTVSGILMDKKSGAKLLIDGKEVTAETTFRPEQANGTVIVEFTFDATGLGDRDVVVFEKLINASGKVIATHEDIGDDGQTVKFIKPAVPDTPKTGDQSMPHNAGLLCMMSLSAMCLALSFKRRKDEI